MNTYQPDTIGKHLLPSNKFAQELTEIWRPLFLASHVRFFGYNRFYNNQSWIGIYSDTEPVRLDLGAQGGPLFVDSVGIRIREGIYIHKDLADILKLSVTKYQIDKFFNQHENPKGKAVVQNGLLIIRKGLHYHESFYFSLLDSSISDRSYYYGVVDNLKDYCLYFLNAAKKIIKFAEDNKTKYVVPTACDNHFDSLFVRSGTSAIAIKKFCFPTAYGDVFLSRQELNCLRLIASGLSQQEISLELSLSIKTVEYYVRNIKNKLVVETKEELLRHYRSFADIDRLNG